MESGPARSSSTAMRLLLFLAALPLWAANDANTIVQRLIDADRQNHDRMQPYTFTEEAVHYSYEKDGTQKKRYTETYDVIFVEGFPFRKLVARNGKPLPRKEQAQIEKAVRQTASERRKQRRPVPGGQIFMNGRSIDIGTHGDLPNLFDVTLTGEEEIRGRKVWVLDAVPKAGRVPATQHERDVMSFRRKYWIDQAESVPVRVRYTVTGDGVNFAMPGSFLQMDADKVGEDAWLEVALVVEIWQQDHKTTRPEWRTEYACSKFQKFDVQSTITVDQEQR